MSDSLPNVNNKTLMGRRSVIIETVTIPVAMYTNGVFTLVLFNLQVGVPYSHTSYQMRNIAPLVQFYRDILRPRTKHIKCRLCPRGHISLLNTISWYSNI
jgi:hypothetical protein